MPKLKKNDLPDRWNNYSSVGKRIPGTRFVAFKVPLKKSFRKKLMESEVFEPLDLMDLMEKDGQELGLIIDLTFTTRYYQLQDLPDSLHYLKIFTRGHEVPDNDTILSFKKAVKHFLRINEHNDKLIGVHCTHGLNRTGYLICRYLIDVDGIQPSVAIKLFNESRGHQIERMNYLDDLRSGPKRSNVGMDHPDTEPEQGRGRRTRARGNCHNSAPPRWQECSSDAFNVQGAYSRQAEPRRQSDNVRMDRQYTDHEQGRGNRTHVRRSFHDPVPRRWQGRSSTVHVRGTYSWQSEPSLQSDIFCPLNNSVGIRQPDEQSFRCQPRGRQNFSTAPYSPQPTHLRFDQSSYESVHPNPSMGSWEPRGHHNNYRQHRRWDNDNY